MNLLSKESAFDADLKDLSLIDLLNKLKEENYFKSDNEFYLVQVVDNNQLIFAVPRNRATPRQIHTFKYLENEHKILIRSQYKNLFFPSFLMYILPLMTMILAWKELSNRDLNILLAIILGITALVAFFAFTSLKERSNHIQRELLIRANYLLRLKGYQVGI